MSESAAANGSAVAKQCTAKSFQWRFTSHRCTQRVPVTQCARKERVPVDFRSTRKLKEMVTTRWCPSGSLRQPKPIDSQTRLTMKCPIEKRQTREAATLHQSLPTKLIQQSRHTSSSPVITLHKSSRTTLNHLQSTHIWSRKRVPGSNRIFQVRPHQWHICKRSCLQWTAEAISTNEI